MHVETFEIQEYLDCSTEELKEQAELVRELELPEQVKLLEQDNGGVTAFPFREMTREETFVYTVLCPTRTTLERYGGETLPLRVLRLVKTYKEAFESFEVRHCGVQREKDPVLIGVRAGTNSWEKHHFLLARWGEELESFPVLLERAIKKERVALAERCQEVIARLAVFVNSPESVTTTKLLEHGAGWTPDFRFG